MLYSFGCVEYFFIIELKGPSIIVNIKVSVCTKHTLLGGSGKNVDSVHFQHFSPFIFINFMANYSFEKC